MEDDAAGTRNPGSEHSYVERKVRNATSNDIDDATFLQLDELTRLTHNSKACDELARAVSTRLVTHFDSWRRVLKSLTLIDYLLHTGSELFVSHLRDNTATIRACLSYTSVEERDRDRAPAIRQAAQRLDNLLTHESNLTAARRAAALILGVVSTGTLRSDGDGATTLQTQARIGVPLVTSAFAKDNVYYRSFIGVPDLTRELSDLSERLGSGGFADVYSASWNRSGDVAAKVAVKVIRDTGVGEEPIFQARHAREISVWHEVRHENILPLYGLHWELSSLPAMVSPWCDNGDLAKYIRAMHNHEDINGLKLKLLEDVLHGLVYLHDYRPVIVHADIKGANVLISDDGVARLSDFGLASVRAEHSKSFTLHTKAKGTIRWMAPELFAEDASRHTTQSDIWAVGCLLLEVQTGRAPYYNLENDAAVLRAIGEHMWPARTDDTPDMLWWLVLECCNPEPNERPHALQVLRCLQDLRKFQANDPGRWCARRSSVDVPPMHVSLARRLTTYMVEDPAFEDHMQSVYLDDVWLQAVHSLLTGEWKGRTALSPYTGPQVLAATLRICISRASSEVDLGVEKNPLCEAVALAVIDVILDRRFIVTETDLDIAKRPASEVEALATLLSQSGTEHAEWVKSHLTSQFLVQPFHGHKSEITCLAFSPDGKYVVSVALDHVMHVLDSATGLSTVGPLKDPPSNVVMLAASLNARRIVTGSHNAGIRVWDGETGSIVLNRLVHSSLECVAISADGNYIMAGNENSEWHMWEADTGRLCVGPCYAEERQDLSACSGIAVMSFSPDGHSVACLSRHGWFTRWTTTDPGQASSSGRILGLHIEGKHALSPDLNYLAGETNSEYPGLGIWDTETFQLLFRLSEKALWLKSLSFTNHGQQVVAAHDEWDSAWITGWNVATGEAAFRIDVEDIVEMAASPVNGHIAAASKDGTVRMWDSLVHHVSAAAVRAVWEGMDDPAMTGPSALDIFGDEYSDSPSSQAGPLPSQTSIHGENDTGSSH